MARIKISGYLDTGDFLDSQLDESDGTGLTAEGYEELLKYDLSNLEDLDVNVERPV